MFARWGFTDPVAMASALADIADPDEHYAAQQGALFGLVMGIDSAGTPERRRKRMLAIEAMFDSLREAAAARGQLDGRGNGAPVPRLLYEYWKESDPARAAKYKEPPERYDER